MIRHILLLQARATTTPAQIEACRAALKVLVGRIPGLLNFHWGDNLAPLERRDGISHGFSMDFSDQQSLDEYGPHPDHKAAAALVRSSFERILILDLAL